MEKNQEKHNQILEALIRDTGKQYDVLVLAQASMSVLIPCLADITKPILSSMDSGVEAAAKAARIHRYIMSLPKGYDTLLDDNGMNLSQGQKQLLTIARAMLLDAKMLILDEATSNVDTRTEIQIQEAMLRLMEGKTCFVIAHRLSTIQNCTRILYVDKGKIQESGSHEELLLNKGPYYNLFMSQYSFMKDKAVQ